MSSVTLKLVVSPSSLLIAALFLSQWLRSIEREGIGSLTTEEARIVSLLRDLLYEADPDADTNDPMSALLLTVWADQFDGVNVWGSDSTLSGFAECSYPEFGENLQGCGGSDQIGVGHQNANGTCKGRPHSFNGFGTFLIYGWV
jgi:hypothetical protein